MKEIKKELKKFAENARHLVKEAVIEAEHELGRSGNLSYGIKKTVEQAKHTVKMTAIEVNNGFIDRAAANINDGLDLVGDAAPSIDEVIN